MKNKDDFIKILNTSPIIQVACQKTGISRATYYRWRKTDKEFKEQSQKAIKIGCSFINDLAESQLISSIKDKNLTAIIYWLNHNHPKYSNQLYLSSSDKKVLVNSVVSSNSQSYKLIAEKMLQGKVSRFLFNILSSLVSKSAKLKQQEMENKKIELLSRVKDH